MNQSKTIFSKVKRELKLSLYHVVEAHRVVRRRGSHIFQTIGLQMAVKLSALRAGRPLPPGRFLVALSVRMWVDPRAMVCQLKKNPCHCDSNPRPSGLQHSASTNYATACTLLASWNFEIRNSKKVHYSLQDESLIESVRFENTLMQDAERVTRFVTGRR
jgi:hypothetical protein